MATSKKRTVEIDVVVDDKAARTSLKGIGNEAESSGGRFSRMGAMAKAGVALAAGAVIGFLKDATTNALEDARAQEQLELAVRNATTASEGQIGALGEYIDKTQAATGITDDQLRPAFANLVRATNDVEEAQKLMTVAMDIATARGLPLEAVTLAIGKAAQGNVGALGRMGLKVRDAEGDYLSFEDAMARAEETFAGATDTFANSAEGKMARVKIAFDEAAEGIGAAVVPIVEGVADIFTNLEKVGDQNFLDAVLTDLKALGDEEANRRENPGIQMMIDSFKALGDMIGIYTVPKVREIGPAAQAAMEEVIPALDEAEGAADDLTGAVGDTTDAFYDQRDAAAALFDPVFGLADAHRELDEATTRAREAAEEHGNTSPEYIAALEDVRQKAVDVQAAEATLADTTGVTRSTMETHLRALRQFTEAEIQLMLDAYARHNAFIITTPRSSQRPYGGGRQEFHTGGVVQGDFPGQEVMVSARAGEVITQSGGNGHGGGGTEIIQLVLDRRVVAEVVREQFIRDNRTGRGWV